MELTKTRELTDELLEAVRLKIEGDCASFAQNLLSGNFVHARDLLEVAQLAVHLTQLQKERSELRVLRKADRPVVEHKPKMKKVS